MENMSLPALCPNRAVLGAEPGQRGRPELWCSRAEDGRIGPHSAGCLGPERLSLRGGMFISPHLESGHGVCPFPEVTARLCQAQPLNERKANGLGLA